MFVIAAPPRAPQAAVIHATLPLPPPQPGHGGGVKAKSGKKDEAKGGKGKKKHELVGPPPGDFLYFVFAFIYPSILHSEY